MNPSRDAGRYAYHLKFLLKADLVEAIVDQKKYCLTELGKMVIEVADKIDKKAQRPKNILIRASRSAIEEFDSNRIANTLVKEAKMPVEQAQKIAKEAEMQLFKSKTRYLTAPLVREVVNAILIEKGLEEYRNKLTRLGIPVHDVSNLLHTPQAVTPLEAAGETVFKEYTLLNALPRDIADAHLSGALHINNLSVWLLKPQEIIHDLRFFLQKGLNLETINPAQPSHPPPTDINTALATTLNVLLHSAKETVGTQTLEYFNIFLAPYMKDADPERTKERLRTFITSINQHADTAINLELTIPGFLAGETSIGPRGKQTGKYRDYTTETQQLASLLLDIFTEESFQKPLLNPKLIVKIRSETFKDERAKALLLKAHALAAHSGIPYFANNTKKHQQQTVYSPSGFKLDVENDWEIDTLRTGCLGIVTINLPRAVYQSEKDKTRFIETLREELEMANRALEIKHQTLRQHSKNLLPFLTQSSNGDEYYRLENAAHTINIAGFKEAAEAFTSKTLDSPEALTLQRETINEINNIASKISKKRGKHLQIATMPNPEATTRLARLDIERYGIAKIRNAGTRDKPHYTTTNRLTFQNFNAPQPQQTTPTQPLGNLTLIELAETTPAAEQILEATKQLLETQEPQLFIYNQKTTYCTNCKKTWPTTKTKCPQCNAISTLIHFDRYNET